jgi:hypothetical protein
MTDTRVRMLEDATTHEAGEIGLLTPDTNPTSHHRWINFESDTRAHRGAWCLPSEYETITAEWIETPALAEEPHLAIAAATDAFNEALARVAEQVATHCDLSITVISELLVSGWAFKPGADGEPNTWTAPTERSN